MTRRKDPTTSDEEPLGKDWKEHWRERESGSPTDKRRARAEKRAERRRVHKQARQIAKRKIEDELPE